MSDKPKLEQIRIMFNRDDLKSIKAQAKFMDQPLSIWIEEAVKDRLESGDLNRIPVKKGDERLRVSLSQGLIEEIENSGAVSDIKIWVKEAIQMKLHRLSN